LQVIKIKEEGTTENLTSSGKLTGGAQQRPPGSQLQIVKAAPTSSTGEQGRGNTSDCMFLVTGGAPVRNSSGGEGGPGHLLEDQLITLKLFNGSGIDPRPVLPVLLVGADDRVMAHRRPRLVEAFIF
jgi:hypothetical protein